ncbi:MAG TPA: LysR family transcriptional regulator [Burkholderiales bacterium]|nr:LysR family transcriptional regulator [Burkholderiales bacterium]
MPRSTRRTAKRTDVSVGLHLRVTLERDVAIGPGKADLLEGIAATGSIAAAGRQMGMSYKRAWLLVNTMNRCFRGELVEAAKGGRAGGGARLTPLGAEVLAAYRRMQARTARAIAKDLAGLKHKLAPRRRAR